MNDNKNQSKNAVEQELGIGDIYEIFMQFKWLVISVVSTAVFLGIILYLWQNPNYNSSAMIVIEENTGSLSLFNIDIESRFSSSVDDELELIKSRTLLESVVQELWNSDKANNLYLFETRTYNPTGLKLAIRKILTLGIWKPQAGMIFNFSESPPDSLINSSIKKIQESMGINNPRRTNIININYNCNAPDEAAEILNRIIYRYKDRDQEWNSGEGSHMRSFLEEQLNNIVVELNEVEETLKDYQEQEKIFGLDDEAAIMMHELASAEAEYYSHLSKINIVQERKLYILNRISESDTTLADELINSVNNQLLALRQEIAASEANLVRNSSLYGENHEAVISTKLKVQKLKIQLVEQTNELLTQGLTVSDPLLYRQSMVDTVITLEGTILGLEGAAREYKKLVDQYTSRLDALPEKSLQYFRLERDRYVLAETYKYLRQKLEEARLNESSQISKVRIVDHAIPRIKQTKPSLVINILLSGILGLCVGSIVAFRKAYLNSIDE